MYMLEVFTKEGIDPQKTRENIVKKTGMVPAIYDKDNHYITNQKLTIDIPPFLGIISMHRKIG
jgi:hypothetical protein